MSERDPLFRSWLLAVAAQQAALAVGALALRLALQPLASRYHELNLTLSMPTKILLSGAPIAIALIAAAAVLLLRARRAWIPALYVTMAVEAVFCGVLGLLLVAVTLPHLMLLGG